MSLYETVLGALSDSLRSLTSLGRPGARLLRRRIEVGSVRRTYWLALPEVTPAPLIVAFHGVGMDGRGMAALTGLGDRATAAGFAVAFPDGWKRVWDGSGGLPGRDGVDDPAYVRAIVEELVEEGSVAQAAPMLVGISHGAAVTEHLARHGLVPVTAIVLVAGTTTVSSRDACPIPAQPAAVLCFEGTGDPAMAYGGGPIGEGTAFGWILRQLARRRGETGDRRVTVGAETVAADWAAANGIPSTSPTEEPFPNRDRDVVRLTWTARGRRPVTVYRIDGGGHGWPGGPQLMPPFLIGPVTRDLDATGILLDVARRQFTGAARLGRAGSPDSRREERRS